MKHCPWNVMLSNLGYNQYAYDLEFCEFQFQNLKVLLNCINTPHTKKKKNHQQQNTEFIHI